MLVSAYVDTTCVALASCTGTLRLSRPRVRCNSSYLAAVHRRHLGNFLLRTDVGSPASALSVFPALRISGASCSSRRRFRGHRLRDARGGQSIARLVRRRQDRPLTNKTYI